MNDILSKYRYQTLGPMNYDEWAEAASVAGDIPVLPQYTAEQLEDIFSKEEWTASERRDSVLRWLSDLERNLNHIWNPKQRAVSGMERLVDDYLSILDL